MQTKSNIQLFKEQLAVKESFCNYLTEMMDKYTFEDNIFSISSRGTADENVTGYFNIDKEFDTLSEAVSSMTKGQSVRIIENKKFQTGTVTNKLLNEGIAYDIATGNTIGE